MISNAQVEESQANIHMQDGYCVLRDRTNGVTSSRYAGRLLMFSIHSANSSISYDIRDQIRIMMQTTFWED